MGKWILCLLTCMAMVFSLASCGGEEALSPDSSGSPNAAHVEKSTQDAAVQGVSDSAILVGNTAAATGVYAAIGMPFKAGMEAAFQWYNDRGGFRGRQVKLVHRDDSFDAAQGMLCTRMLVEEDRVFALVGHFGTNTVAATLDYLKQVGIPVLYAATGISGLYQEGATGKDAAIFPVRPTYDGEGRVLLARALATTEGGCGLGGTRIGVISTTDDAGRGMLAGIRRQEQETDVQIVYQEVDVVADDYTAAVSVLKNQGCDVVIAAMNQIPLATCLQSMRDIHYNARVITSHVSANVATLGALVDSGAITAERPVYATDWLDLRTGQGAQELLEFVEMQLAWEDGQGMDSTDPAQTVRGDSFAMAGYMAAMLFLHGLEQVEAQNLELNWENYISAVESKPYHIPMGGDIDYAGGDRLGSTALSLNTITLEKNQITGTYDLQTVSPIMSLEEVWAKVP